MLTRVCVMSRAFDSRNDRFSPFYSHMNTPRTVETQQMVVEPERESDSWAVPGGVLNERLTSGNEPTVLLRKHIVLPDREGMELQVKSEVVEASGLESKESRLPVGKELHGSQVLAWQMWGTLYAVESDVSVPVTWFINGFWIPALLLDILGIILNVCNATGMPCFNHEDSATSDEGSIQKLKGHTAVRCLEGRYPKCKENGR